MEVNLTDNLLLLANSWNDLLNFQMGYFKNVDSATDVLNGWPIEFLLAKKTSPSKGGRHYCIKCPFFAQIHVFWETICAQVMFIKDCHEKFTLGHIYWYSQVNHWAFWLLHLIVIVYYNSCRIFKFLWNIWILL